MVFMQVQNTNLYLDAKRNHVLTLSGSWCHFCVPLRSGVLSPPILHILIGNGCEGAVTEAEEDG